MGRLILPLQKLKNNGKSVAFLLKKKNMLKFNYNLFYNIYITNAIADVKLSGKGDFAHAVACL
jgi:hypothetical protein